MLAFGYVEENEEVLNQFFYHVDKQGCISAKLEQIGDLHLTPEQMEKIGVQLRMCGTEQLKKIGFVPKPQVSKPARVPSAAKPAQKARVLQRSAQQRATPSNLLNSKRLKRMPSMFVSNCLNS